MTLSTRDRRAIMIGVAAVAVVLAAEYVVFPWWDSWGEARTRMASAGQTLNALEGQLERLLAMRHRLVRRYGAAATQPITDVETTRLRFFETAQAVFKDAGIQFPVVQPQKPRSARELPGMRLLPFQIKFTSDLSKLAKLLVALRRADQLVIVDRITAASEKKKPGQLDVAVTLVVLATKESAS